MSFEDDILGIILKADMTLKSVILRSGEVIDAKEFFKLMGIDTDIKVDGESYETLSHELELIIESAAQEIIDSGDQE